MCSFGANDLKSHRCYVFWPIVIITFNLGIYKEVQKLKKIYERFIIVAIIIINYRCKFSLTCLLLN